MSELPERHTSAAVRQIKQHQFLSMIIGAILTSFFLVYVALGLYQSSGTLQLDLSRPGYDMARKEASRDDNEVFEGFSPRGSITEESLAQFEKLYAEKARDSASVEAFGGQALSDEALRLD